MNAYELADILHQSDFLAMDFAEDAATMLRQQADRIAELEKSHIELEKGILKKLNQEMISKPVAWMMTLPDGTHDWILESSLEEGYIPLYTHPVKQLSDEEILDFAFKHHIAVSKDTDVFLLEHNIEDLIDFARAIIKEITE